MNFYQNLAAVASLICIVCVTGTTSPVSDIENAQSFLTAPRIANRFENAENLLDIAAISADLQRGFLRNAVEYRGPAHLVDPYLNLKFNREFIESTFQHSADTVPIQRMSSTETDVIVSLFRWGYVVELDPFAYPSFTHGHCEYTISILASNIKTQIKTLQYVFEGDISSYQEANTLAAFGEQQLRNAASEICRRIPERRSRYAAMWITPRYRFRFMANFGPQLPGSMSFGKAALFAFDSEAIISGGIVARLAYKPDERLPSLNDNLVQLFPGIFGSSPFTKVYQLKMKNMFMSVSKESLVFSFRGTYELKDWFHDLDMRQVMRNVDGTEMRFHRGFERAYALIKQEFYQLFRLGIKAMAEDPERLPLKNFYFAGHSLGGSLATYATYDLFTDLLPTMLKEDTQSAAYLHSLEDVKKVFWGVVIGAPPIADGAFAASFGKLGLRFFNIYADFDKVGNFIYMVGGITDRDTKAADESKWHLLHWIRKMARWFWKKPWVTVGKRIKLEDYVYPGYGSPKKWYSWFFVRHWARSIESHRLPSYLEFARKLVYFTDAKDAANVRFLFPNDKFRLYSYQNDRYCVIKAAESGFVFSCDVDLDEARARPFMARNLYPEFEIVPQDYHPLSFCKDTALMSNGSGTTQILTGSRTRFTRAFSISTRTLRPGALQTPTRIGGDAIWSMSLWNDKLTKECIFKDVARFGKNIVLVKQRLAASNASIFAQDIWLTADIYGLPVHPNQNLRRSRKEGKLPNVAYKFRVEID